jgi:mono/diheme cytochrome c family protein
VNRRSEVNMMKRPNEGLLTGSKMLSALAFSCLMLASTGATPQTAPEPQEKTKAELEQLIYSVKGPELFRAHCAACHGPDAKGGGPMAPALKTKVPDLTILAKKNGGQFPSVRVRKSIMGDDVVMSHGSREMPIWGPIFHQIESDQDFGAVRLQNLLKYLESIQMK